SDGETTYLGDLVGGPFVGRAVATGVSPNLDAMVNYEDALVVLGGADLGGVIDTGTIELELSVHSDPMQFSGVARSRISLWVQVEYPPIQSNVLNLAKLGPLVYLGEPAPVVSLNVELNQQPIVSVWAVNVVQLK